jgi:hypothetical protein
MWTIRRDREIDITPQALDAWKRLRAEGSVTVSSPSGEGVIFAITRDALDDDQRAVPVLRTDPPLSPWDSASPRSRAFAVGVRTRFSNLRRARPTVLRAIAAVQQGAIVPHEETSAVGYKLLFRHTGMGGLPCVMYVYETGDVLPDLPRRESPPAGCYVTSHQGPSPVKTCGCGYHAAYGVVELMANCRAVARTLAGVLIVTPLGRTLWHRNAWRAERYWVAAAVLPKGARVPRGWDPQIPVVLSDWVPGTAHDIARELRAERALLRTPDEPQPTQP